MDTPEQREAPYWEALRAFASSDARMFSTPGHKRGRGASSDVRAAFGAMLNTDIPHGGGVDTTHLSFGLLRRAERLAAAAYGGDDARFLVNGSTTGNIAMLLATCREGDEVLISRMLHKSLLAGLIFSGARPIYLTPAIDPARNLPLDTTAEVVDAGLAAHPAARAVALVSPSYVGVTSDVQAIARRCARAGLPLLVDEAWGPHFHFHPALPRSAMQSGADAAVSSTHKMLAAVTQGSTLVARAGRLDLQRLGAMVDMTQTTSPSAQIFASLDASRRQMVIDGEVLLTRALQLAARLREGLSRIAGLRVLDRDLLAGQVGADFDPTRVMIDVHELGLTGYEAEQLLRAEHGVHVEMSDLLGVMLLVTIGDDDESIERALRGCAALVARRRPARHEVAARSSGELLFGGEQIMTPREAFVASSEAVSLTQARGRVSAESVTPYPPGIPIVTPGERVGTHIIDYLRAGLAEGMYVSGLADPTCATLRVVA